MPQIWIELGVNKLIGKKSISNETAGQKERIGRIAREKKRKKGQT